VTITLRKVVAKNVRFHRKSLGLSQEELATKCKMHDNYISKVELAKISIGIDNLERIAVVLKVPPYVLLLSNTLVI
jgi:transcriptional regulator with XRE-family HTH domain